MGNKCLLILLVFLVFTTVTSCKVQLVQRLNDVENLQIQKDDFINQPLKRLLKEIKPAIKSVRVIPGTAERLSTIYFYFLTETELKKYERENGQFPAEIRVRLLKHDFKWDPASKPQNEQYDWTKTDEKEFGKLTVVDIKVRKSKQ